MATRILYTQELKQLNENVVRMEEKVEKTIKKVMEALTSRDEALAKKIIADDDKFDLLEQEIEIECFLLVARQSPVAGDLRKITAIMRLIGDLERIADHCSDIAEYILRLPADEDFALPEGMWDMLFAMKEMVTDAINSFVTFDTDKAEKVIQQDNVVDKAFEKLRVSICEMMKLNPAFIESGVDYLMMIKYVERMADHATNIAEWVFFIVEGKLKG